MSAQNSLHPLKADALTTWSLGHSSDPPSDPDSSKQRAWDAPHVKAAFAKLLEGSTPQDTGRLLAVQRRETGAWLTAPPVSSLGLRLEDDAVRIGVGLRLGTPLCSAHKCTLCGNQVDDRGTHGLHCRKKPCVHSRHAALNDVIKRSLAAVDVPSILEPVGLCRLDGKRADGVTIIPWKRGRALAWDVTVWDMFAPSYLSLAASGAASIANRAEAKKRNLYQELIHTHHFIPIGLETLGVFGDEALAFLKELGHLTKMKTSDSQSFTYMCQRISVIIQRYNAEAIYYFLSCCNG